MNEEAYRAFAFDFLGQRVGKMYDDVTPAEVVEWLFSNWPKEQPSKDEVLRHLLETSSRSLRISSRRGGRSIRGDITGKDPYSFERNVTRGRQVQARSWTRWTSCAPM
jgi:hypothetical protein